MTTWTIEPMALHRVSVPGPEVFFQRGFRERVELVIYAFLLRSRGAAVLVDTGLMADYSALNQSIRARKGEESGFHDLGSPLAERLRDRGFRPDAVVVTSFGPYAVGGLQSFDGIPIFASARGCADLACPEEPALTHLIPPTVRDLLLSERTKRVAGEAEIVPGLRLIEVGVHHPASAAVVAATQAENVAISDPVFLARNLTEGLALGASENAAQWHGLVRRIGRAAEAILPIHDPHPLPVPRSAWHSIFADSGARGHLMAHADASTNVPSASFRTKAELAYDHLREQVVNGTFAPGQRLTLANLSKSLGLSQVPIREALLRLEQEGLLESEPHKGMRVMRLSLSDAQELFEIRCELEGLAAFRASMSGDEQLAADLRAINRAFADAFGRGDFTAMGQANWAFHRRVLRAAASGQLSRLLEDIWMRSFRFRLGYRLIPGRAECTIAEHAGIVDAVSKRDPDLARAAARHHITRAGAELRKSMSDGGETG